MALRILKELVVVDYVCDLPSCSRSSGHETSLKAKQDETGQRLARKANFVRNPKTGKYYCSTDHLASDA